MKYIKFISTILLSALLAYAIGIYTTLPWYSFVFTNALIAIVIPQAPWKSFLSGAVGVGLLWFVLAYLTNQDNASLLATKVAQIIHLKGSVNALLGLTGFVGFIIGGMASLSAAYIRSKKSS